MSTWVVVMAAVVCFGLGVSASRPSPVIPDDVPPPPPVGEVTTLDSTTYEIALRENMFGVILFYVPWCPHCKVLRPVFTQIAQNEHIQKMGVKLGEIDCEDQQDMCLLLGVKSYPTIRYYRAGQVYKYDGGRMYERLLDFSYFVAAGAHMNYMDIVGNLDLYCVQEPYKMRFLFLHKVNNTGSEGHKAMIGAVTRNIH